MLILSEKGCGKYFVSKSFLFSHQDYVFHVVNPLSASPTEWSKTLKQFVGELFECLTILWGWRLKG